MPLLTRIAKPKEFTAEIVADLMWTAIVGTGPIPRPAGVNQTLIGLAQYILEQLGARGIIGDWAIEGGWIIAKPELFNAVTFAILVWESTSGPGAFERGAPEPKRETVDQAQYILDALYQRGIIE